MAGSHRKPINQDKHDREVRKIARDYERRGYNVEADVPGYHKPPSVGGHIPDVRAKKGKYETMVEVETPETAAGDHAASQEAAFRRAARRNPNKHFKKRVTY